jgi:hypothetical protein
MLSHADRFVLQMLVFDLIKLNRLFAEYNLVLIWVVRERRV